MHVSRDGGGTWNDVTPDGLPEWTMVSFVEPSRHDAGTAYVAATRYKLDDNRPFLFRTNDYGSTWTPIVDGIPADDFTRVLREDHEQPGLLYAGTETGVYASTDDGGSWSKMQLNLPVAPIYDLEVKDGDLVAATHGRSFWVLDDLTPLRQAASDTPKGTHLFEPRPAIRFMKQLGSIVESGPGKHYTSDILGAPASWIESTDTDGRTTRKGLDSGVNPPEGAAIDFHLDDATECEVAIEVLDANGTVVRRLSTCAEGADKLSARAGLNRAWWDLRHRTSEDLPDEAGGASPFGSAVIAPLAAPGAYTVRLTAGGESRTASLDVLVDPRSNATQAELDEQLALQLRIRDKYDETRDRVMQMRAIKAQLDEWQKRAGDGAAEEIGEAASRIRERLSDSENAIVPFRTAGPQPRGIPVGLYAKLKEFMGIVAGADWPPTASSYELLDDLSARLEVQFDVVQAIIDNDIPAFTTLLEESGVPAISTD